jgi:hypothetical protein
VTTPTSLEFSSRFVLDSPRAPTGVSNDMNEAARFLLDFQGGFQGGDSRRDSRRSDVGLASSVRVDETGHRPLTSDNRLAAATSQPSVSARARSSSTMEVDQPERASAALGADQTTNSPATAGTGKKASATGPPGRSSTAKTKEPLPASPQYKPLPSASSALTSALTGKGKAPGPATGGYSRYRHHLTGSAALTKSVTSTSKYAPPAPSTTSLHTPGRTAYAPIDFVRPTGVPSPAIRPSASTSDIPQIVPATQPPDAGQPQATPAASNQAPSTGPDCSTTTWGSANRPLESSASSAVGTPPLLPVRSQQDSTAIARVRELLRSGGYSAQKDSLLAFLDGKNAPMPKLEYMSKDPKPGQYLSTTFALRLD